MMDCSEISVPAEDCFQDSSKFSSKSSQESLNKNDSFACIGRKNSLSTKYGRYRRSRSSLSSAWLFLVLVFFGAILSKHNNPLLFAEARAPIRPMTSISQPRIFQSPTPQPHPAYTWGNFGHEPELLCFAARMEARLVRLVHVVMERIKLEWKRFLDELTVGKVFGFALKCFRSWVFWFFSRDCLASIYEDRWHAERDPDKFFGSQGMWVNKGAHKDVVKRRIQRSRRNRQWVGLGYTPRLVWLVGVLLRGTFQCTAIPKVFNPSLTGWGAGTILGAKCTHQEWISTFMIGWFGSEHYWKYLFGCRGPPFAEPGFTGIPVFITKVRDVRLN